MLGAMVINLSAPAQDVCYREQTGYGEQGTHVNSFWGAAYEAASGTHDRTARLIPSPFFAKCTDRGAKNLTRTI